MAERLPWFTLEVEHWLNKMRGVHAAVKGALLELDCWSWAHGEPACTLPDDDDELTGLSALGVDGWALYGARVRKLLRKDEFSGRLFDPHLMAIYMRQSSRAQTNRSNGRLGAEARWGKTKPTSIGSILGQPPPSDSMPNAIPNGKANAIPSAMPNAIPTAMPVGMDSPRVSSKILSLEVLETKDFRSNGGEFVASAIAVATDSQPDDSDSADSALVLGQEPPQLSEADRLAFGKEYYRRLSGHYETWATQHPDEAAQLEAKERKLFAWPEGELKPVQQKVLRDALLERLRELKGWPTSDEWVALQLARGETAGAS
jgi:hypothetical protein